MTHLRDHLLKSVIIRFHSFLLIQSGLRSKSMGPVSLNFRLCCASRLSLEIHVSFCYQVVWENDRKNKFFFICSHFMECVTFNATNTVCLSLHVIFALHIKLNFTWSCKIMYGDGVLQYGVRKHVFKCECICKTLAYKHQRVWPHRAKLPSV